MPATSTTAGTRTRGPTTTPPRARATPTRTRPASPRTCRHGPVGPRLREARPSGPCPDTERARAFRPFDRACLGGWVTSHRCLWLVTQPPCAWLPSHPVQGWPTLCQYRSDMAFLAIPQPYDFALSTERFRAFGIDLANLWHEGGLHRVVGE